MSKSKDIGRNFEYRVRDAILAKGYDAQRVLLSGQSGQTEKCDIISDIGNFECKKTNAQSLSIQRTWCERIGVDYDAILFSFYKTDIYKITEWII
jgi:hypothetical protein